MKKILIVDDDLHIGNMLEETLRREGYRVLRAYSGTEALYVLERETPDLVLLDLMLPGLDGEELLPRITEIPVIVVSAKADVADKVTLLLGGAADYVTKPFNLQELLARIAVQLRAAEGRGISRELRCGTLVLDLDTHTASFDMRPRSEDRAEAAADEAREGTNSLGEMREGTDGLGEVRGEMGGLGEAADGTGKAAGQCPRVRLTRTEFAILKLLMQNPMQVLSKSMVLDRIGDETPDCTEGSLKMHVSNLRKKLRELDGEDHIESVWGIGFRLKQAERA